MKKSLSPEVLPDNFRSALADGDPRLRTRKHLRRLLDAATLAAGGIGLQACVGYGVVDPMPTPACQRETVQALADGLVVTATWQSGAIQADIRVTSDTGARTVLGAYTTDGGTTTEISADEGHLVLSIAPGSGDTVDVLVAATCADNAGSTAPSGTIRVRFHVSGDRTDGVPVPTTVSAE